MYDGNRVVKMTIKKNIPASVCVADLDCSVCYRRQPAFCVICKRSGYCGKASPLDAPALSVLPPARFVAKGSHNALDSATHSAPAAYAALAENAPAPAPAAPDSSSAILSVTLLVYVDEKSAVDFVPA